MKKTKFNYRKCIICQKKFHKSALIKFNVVNQQVNVSDGMIHNTHGKGCYACKQLEWDVQTIKLLSKKLHCNLDQTVINQIQILCKGDK